MKRKLWQIFIHLDFVWNHQKFIEKDAHKSEHDSSFTFLGCSHFLPLSLVEL